MDTILDEFKLILSMFQPAQIMLAKLLSMFQPAQIMLAKLKPKPKQKLYLFPDAFYRFT